MTYPFTDPPAVPQRGDRATFSNRVDAFLNWMAALIPQLQAFLANLTSYAAGGAYALPYAFWADLTTVGAGNGRLSIQGDPTAATTVYVSFSDSRGINVKNMLTDVFSSGSTTKAYLTIYAVSDPSRWITYRVTSWAFGAVGVIGVAYSGSSSQYPILADDALVVSVTRAGDKGDPGNATPVAYIRNQVGNGVAPQTFLANTWNTVQMNGAPYNTISGLTVSSGTINNLPAGTYWAEGSSPALANGTHQIRLFNITDGTVLDIGTSERNDSGSPLRVTRSFIRTAFTITGTKSIRMEHWVSTQTTNGSPASAGGGELYGELRITKVA